MDQANEWQEHFYDEMQVKVLVNDLAVACELAVTRWGVGSATVVGCRVEVVDFGSAFDMMEVVDCDALAIYCAGTLVNSVDAT